MNIVAIITARGGSKGLPGKNIRLMNGLPMIVYSIRAGLHCDAVEEVVVTSDDDEILDISMQYGAMTIRRPDYLANDTASSYDAVEHCLKCLKDQGKSFDAFVLLQPTSPLRNYQHLTEAIQTFTSTNAKSCLSVCKAEHHPYKSFVEHEGKLQPVKDMASMHAPRQNLPMAYRANGAIYIMGCEDFMRHPQKAFIQEPLELYIMNSSESIDIDDMRDFKLAEALLSDTG